MVSDAAGEGISCDKNNSFIVSRKKFVRKALSLLITTYSLFELFILFKDLG